MNTNYSYNKNTIIYSPYELVNEYVGKFINSAKEFAFASEDYLASGKNFIPLEKERDSLTVTLQEVINKLNEVQSHAKITFKATKRLMSGKTPDEIATLYDELGQIHSIFSDIINTMKSIRSYEKSNKNDKHQTKLIEEKLFLGSKVLLKMSEALKTSESKLKKEDGNIQTIPRFDKWIEKQAVGDPVQNPIYQELYRIIQSYFLRNNPINATDLPLLHRMHLGTFSEGELKSLDPLSEFEAIFSVAKTLKRYVYLRLINLRPQQLNPIGSSLDKDSAFFLLKVKLFLESDLFPHIELTEDSFWNDDIIPLIKPYLNMDTNEFVHLMNQHLRENAPNEKEIPTDFDLITALNCRFIIQEGIEWKEYVSQFPKSKEAALAALDFLEKTGMDPSKVNQIKNFFDHLSLDHPSRDLFLPDFCLWEHKYSALNIDKSQILEFRSFIRSLIEDIRLTFHRQKTLLEELNEEVKNCQDLGEEEVLKYTIHYRQFIMNPFDIPVKLDISFVCEPLLKIINQPPSMNYSKKTLQYKIEGLKKIRAYYEKNKNLYPQHSILISGAGPSGLTLALVYAVQAQRFQILETRSMHDPMRNNIIVLGKENYSGRLKTLGALEPTGPYPHDDIKILDFFGVTDRLIDGNKALYEKNVGLNVKIMDLQKAALEQINEITRNEGEEDRLLIYYNTEIESITPQNEKEPVLIKFKTSPRVEPGRGFEGTLEPTLVHVTEGYQTTTRKLLGIDVIKQSKPMRFVYSLFEEVKPSTNYEALNQSLTNLNGFLCGAASTANVLAQSWMDKIFNNAGGNQHLFDFLGRAELKLWTPESAYFYATLTQKEQKAVAKLEMHVKIAENERNELERSLYDCLFENQELIIDKDKLDDLLHKLSLKDRRKKWHQDKKEVKQFFQNALEIVQELPAQKEKTNELIRLKRLNSTIKNLNQEIGKLTKEMAIFYQSRWDMLISLLQKQPFKFKPMQHIQTQMTYAQVQTVSNNYRCMRETLFCITGDAECTTDPASGAGMRTSLLRTVSASVLGSALSNKNGFMASAFQWSSRLASKRMREEGLYIRTYYQTGTERLERYTEIAKEVNVISEKEERFLLRMQAKAKMARSDPRLNFTEKELKSLSSLQDTLRETYSRSMPTNAALVSLKPSNAITIVRDNLASLPIAELKDVKNQAFINLNYRLGLYFHLPYLERKMVVRLAKIVAADPKLENEKNYRIFKKNIEAILFKIPPELRFNADESETFKKAWKTAVLKEENKFSDEELTLLASVNSKVASRFHSVSDNMLNTHLSDAWFIPLFFAIEQMKQHP